MPYRRLPNTDNSRIRALKTVISKSNSGEKVITYDIQKLTLILRNFENAQLLYKESLSTQANENKKFQKLVKNARIYISHFIQVLNLCVIRNEIKKDQKALYEIEADNFAVPDLSSIESLLTWGENIINGEQKRISKGGTPIYNPTIARVKVAYSQFKDAQFIQKRHQLNTSRQLTALSEQRDQIDEILCTIWNEIEETFSNLSGNDKIEKCKEYGIVYYLRKNERERLNKEEVIVNENN